MYRLGWEWEMLNQVQHDVIGMRSRIESGMTKRLRVESGMTLFGMTEFSVQRKLR